jgi:hypothetical protein
MSKQVIAIAFALSILAFLYCLGGVAMACWVAALPGNTPQHIRLNFLVWVPASLFTFAVSIYLAWRLAR